MSGGKEDDAAENAGEHVVSSPRTGVEMDLFGLSSLGPADGDYYEKETASYIDSF